MRFKECGYPVGLWVLLLMMPALSRNDHDFAGKNTSKVTMRIEPTWTAAPDIPLAVRAGNTAGYTRNDTGWVYIVSGRDYNERITKTVQRFNATTARWDTVAPHPSGLLGAATAVVEDSLYIIGGVVNPPGTGQRIVHKYDIKENTWSQAAPLPFALVDAKAASYQDSLIYVAGGFTSAINNGLVYLYNAKSRSWRAASFIPSNGRLNFGGFAITGDTLVYMCGTPGFGSPITYNTVYIGVINQVDRAIIDWSTGQAFPGQTRTFFDAHPWGNGGIIMTGGSANNSLNSASDECYVFHPASNRWTALPTKLTAWLTGQSASFNLNGSKWQLVCASGYDGSSYLSITEVLTDSMATVGVENFDNSPRQYNLWQNYPNPFNPRTNIAFRIADFGFVELKIYNMLGREIKTLLSEKIVPGRYELPWDGTNNAGVVVSSGIYIYRIVVDSRGETASFTQSRKMLLLR